MHKHITLHEALESVINNPNIETDGCERCRQLMDKARRLNEGLAADYFAQSQNTAFPLSDESDDSILARLARSKSSEKIRVLPARRITMAAAASIAAAVILLAVNFFYTSGSAEFRYPVTQGKVLIERKGLFFSSRTLGDSFILPSTDTVTALTDISLDCRGMKILASKGSIFRINNTDAIAGSKLVTGKFFISFNSGTEKKWEITLPAGYQVTVTGTKIYFAVADRQSTVFVKEGSAHIADSFGSIRPLEKAVPVIVSDVTITSERSISNKIAGEIKDIFPESDIANRSETESRSETKSRGEEEITDENSAIIRTNDGRSYSGTFQNMGKYVEVSTKDGTIRIPTENIKSITPENRQ
jgi:hypothetical protein